MDQQIKEQWVEALRSGRYNQGQGCLRTHIHGDDESNDKFCCLGVLADIMMPDNYDWAIAQGSAPLVWTGELGENGYAEVELPFDLKEIAGIDDDECSELMNMNDGGEDVGHIGRTFKYIANYIEEHM
jgi:hypothetical protein